MNDMVMIPREVLTRIGKVAETTRQQCHNALGKPHRPEIGIMCQYAIEQIDDDLAVVANALDDGAVMVVSAAGTIIG